MWLTNLVGHSIPCLCSSKIPSGPMHPSKHTLKLLSLFLKKNGLSLSTFVHLQYPKSWCLPISQHNIFVPLFVQESTDIWQSPLSDECVFHQYSVILIRYTTLGPGLWPSSLSRLSIFLSAPCPIVLHTNIQENLASSSSSYAFPYLPAFPPHPYSPSTLYTTIFLILLSLGRPHSEINGHT